MEFTLFWRTGDREIISGPTIHEAMSKHYSAGALAALDFWANGDDRSYTWDADRREWIAALDKEES